MVTGAGKWLRYVDVVLWEKSAVASFSDFVTHRKSDFGAIAQVHGFTVARVRDRGPRMEIASFPASILRFRTHLQHLRCVRGGEGATEISLLGKISN